MSPYRLNFTNYVYRYLLNMYIDLHHHMSNATELQTWRRFFSEYPDFGLYLVSCATHAEEAKWLFSEVAADENLARHVVPVTGLHPWYADGGIQAVQALRPYLEQSPIIGEIGLDRPWCTVPLSAQQEVFYAQLEIAYLLKKPVLIHSKGYEETVLKMLRDFPYPKVIHWYSASDHRLLDDYLALGCHFTLGADRMRNPDCRPVWELVPLEYLHLESDGYEAILWAEENFGTPETLAAAPILHTDTDVSAYAHAQAGRVTDGATEMEAPGDFHGVAVVDSIAYEEDALPAAWAREPIISKVYGSLRQGVARYAKIVRTDYASVRNTLANNSSMLLGF